MTAIAYHQDRFPPDPLDWPQLLPLIGPANAAVGQYDGVLHGIPNPNILLSPLTTQEAVLSSRIEGTQTTIGEVLEFEAEGEPGDESTARKADIPEPTARRIFRLVRDGRLLRKLRASSGGRPAVLAFPELLNICEGGRILLITCSRQIRLWIGEAGKLTRKPSWPANHPSANK